jgi:hypothetical protein
MVHLHLRSGSVRNIAKLLDLMQDIDGWLMNYSAEFRDLEWLYSGLEVVTSTVSMTHLSLHGT